LAQIWAPPFDGFIDALDDRDGAFPRGQNGSHQQEQGQRHTRLEKNGRKVCEECVIFVKQGNHRQTSAHIHACGEKAHLIKKEASFKARRWVVERCLSWMNRFRRILIRQDKKPKNYLAFLYFACGLVALRAAGLFG
jgi:transposase